MKSFFCLITTMKLVVAMLLWLTMASTTHMMHIVVPKALTRDSSWALKEHQMIVNEDKAAALGNYATGSSLPDCTHACGSCSPCIRVMISSKCLLSESCPIIYRCLCKGRFFHVPAS